VVERCRTSRFFPDSGPLGESGTDKCAVEPCDFGLSEELTSERAWFDFWEEHLEPSAVGWDSPENKAIFRFANAVCPGHIETPMGLAVLAGDSGIQALHPPGRLGLSKEVAAAALFPASDESSVVTGSTLAMDGGYSAR